MQRRGSASDVIGAVNPSVRPPGWPNPLRGGLVGQGWVFASQAGTRWRGGPHAGAALGVRRSIDFRRSPARRHHTQARRI